MVDRDRMTVTIDGRVITPTRQTWRLCEYLSAHPGYVRSRLQIMDALGISHNSFDRAVTDVVKRARAEGITCIRNRQGLGYAWVA